ncbi:DNA (cytosine-5)-methyltransferase 3C [Frankliniella fusca]|uniref:DNA (Cytosine-5)-methyltransferase 3C n=1 Tax=Frankliniella fusca TaxID=407009 RepID=A0AAE1LLS2_9NEOP|nr:DNA (cytosine-5)-methyltransferase 3C [Frankliniella fusca]
MATLTTEMTLRDYLEPFRNALVQKVPRLTRNVAAHRSGKEKIRSVELNGKAEYRYPIDHE